MATSSRVARMRRTAGVSSSGALVARGMNTFGLPGASGPTISTGFDVGGAIAGGTAAGGCDLLPAGWMRDACKLGGAVIGGGRGGSGATGGGSPGTGIAIPGGGTLKCPPGKIRVGEVCVAPGDAFPGGDPFVTGAGGVPVTGAFGLPAFQPEVVGSINGSPVRRCPSRTVLGMDNLCYPKGTIGRNYRKWPPAAKPPVTAYDAKMMRKYGPGGSKQGRVKALAQASGFTCKKK